MNHHCKSAAGESHCSIIWLPLIGVNTPFPDGAENRRGGGLVICTCSKGCNSIDSIKRGQTCGFVSPWMSFTAGPGWFNFNRQVRGIQVGMATCQTAFLIYRSHLCLGHQQGRSLCLDFSVCGDSRPIFFSFSIQFRHILQSCVKSKNCSRKLIPT